MIDKLQFVRGYRINLIAPGEMSDQEIDRFQTWKLVSPIFCLTSLYSSSQGHLRK